MPNRGPVFTTQTRAAVGPMHVVDQPRLITLRRSGVEPERIYIDTASGAEASRPKWDLERALLRSG